VTSDDCHENDDEEIDNISGMLMMRMVATMMKIMTMVMIMTTMIMTMSAL